MIEIDATCNNYPATISLWDYRLGGSAIVGSTDTVLAYGFKDSTAVSLWDPNTAAAKSEKWQDVERTRCFQRYETINYLCTISYPCLQ
jgi:hypothetical protein